MTSLTTTIESLLFVATKPLTTKRLAELTQATIDDIELALQSLTEKYNVDGNGIQLVHHNSSIQFVSSPDTSKVVTEYLKEEQAGELTRPALETLTIIAYRGPISKVQLDTIRGVNCALILRNLMIKGLIEAKTHKDRMQTSYEVTMDFLRFLGLTSISELPEYDRLHREETLEALLNPQTVTATDDGETSSEPKAESEPA